MNKDQRNIEIGKFLRKKRNALTSESYNCISNSKRRTPGLRREEVAVLAGVSSTWYTWLEQGRPINASIEVLEQIAKVLKLTQDEKDYLFTLSKQHNVIHQEEDFSEIMCRMRRLIEPLKDYPSYVIDREWNVLCWNNACTELFGDFSQVKNRNTIWMMFFDRRYKSVFKNWEQDAHGMLGRYKKVTTNLIEDVEWRKRIDSMCSDSSEFHTWWNEEYVNILRTIHKCCIHPMKGEMNYELNCLQIQEAPDYTLIMHVPVI